VRDLGQVPLIEERELEGAADDQGLNRRGPQRGDPVESVDRPEIFPEAGVREHPAVANQHHARDRESLADLLDLRREGLGISGVAFEHFDRDRAAVPVRQEPEDDLELVPPPIARVAELRQRALPALEVGGGDVIEDEAALGQMPAGEGLFHARLPGQEPIHRLVEGVLVGVRDGEARAERGLRGLGLQGARRRELGAGVQDARRNQGLDEIPRSGPLGGEERGQPQLPHRAQDRGDVAVRPGADDLERVIGRDQDVAPHRATNHLNDRGGEAGEIAERFVLDLAGVTIGATQEVIAIAPAAMRAGDLGHMTGPGGARHTGTLRRPTAACQA
jgi:hypothetical protein